MNNGVFQAILRHRRPAARWSSLLEEAFLDTRFCVLFLLIDEIRGLKGQSSHMVAHVLQTYVLRARDRFEKRYGVVRRCFALWAANGQYGITQRGETLAERKSDKLSEGSGIVVASLRKIPRHQVE